MQGIRTKEDILNDIECTEDDIRANKRRLEDIEEEISDDEDLLDALKKEDGVKPGSIISSLHKLLRLGYIDGDYKVIKSLKIDDISIRIGRSYITIGEVKKELKKYDK